MQDVGTLNMSNEGLSIWKGFLLTLIKKVIL